ncbi:hypothetical protein G6514_008418 [Epicoccum nigrum]|nr:hypothetical protein G6514_008418 [Epicoccum nigrum]
MQLGSSNPSGMTYPLVFILLLSFAAHTNGLPIDLRTGTPDILTTRGEAKSEGKGLSDEAIIGIAAIFASIFLFILGLVLAAPRTNIFRCCGQRKATKTRQKPHHGWHRSRY